MTIFSPYPYGFFINLDDSNILIGQNIEDFLPGFHGLNVLNLVFLYGLFLDLLGPGLFPPLEFLLNRPLCIFMQPFGFEGDLPLIVSLKDFILPFEFRRRRFVPFPPSLFVILFLLTLTESCVL